ncbi:MAG: hypothetical protein JXR96_11515 [Deltaproteobacteria bacterium]|nr:hypothetical protein [Deltaproteobacteria bacterium]
MKSKHDPFQGDSELEAFVRQALTRASESVAERRGPLMPFAMVDDDWGDQRIQRFCGSDYRDDVCCAFQFARQNGSVRWAVAWDGRLSGSEDPREAVFVRAGINGSGRQLLFAWKIARDPGGTAETIGSPLLLDDVDRQ